MNINDYPDDLKLEEQLVLNKLIVRMDREIKGLDDTMKQFVREAKDADISVNPDEYLSKVLAQKGIKDTEENRKRLLQARDELYTTRLLLQYKDEDGEGILETKVGLHPCCLEGEQLVTSWTMPIVRNFVFNNSLTEYDSIVPEKYGEDHCTHYKLLVKNQVTLRFTRVVKAMNLFPGIFDDKEMEKMKGIGFFSDSFLDKMIDRFNPDEYDAESAANIISDEFLQELLERRSTPEFKNIVFSIQKKQGEIIQAPYSHNMIVQGCAGSGKSMIMLHRLPIILFDNPNSLSRTNLYIITPSQMYIQMAENMRHQLEISDINMGTLEQYYDYCIEKYPGHKEGEYGEIRYNRKISAEDEQYIYSSQCLKDIEIFYENILEETTISLEKAFELFQLVQNDRRLENTYAQKIGNRLLDIQSVLNANNNVLIMYFKRIKDALDALMNLSAALQNRKDKILLTIARSISTEEEAIKQAQNELEKLSIEKNAIAIKNREGAIIARRRKLLDLAEERAKIEADTQYFDSLQEVDKIVKSVIAPFKNVKNEYSQNTDIEIYGAVKKIGQLIGGYFMLDWELSKIDEKYNDYLDSIKGYAEKVERCILVLQNMSAKYLDTRYYSRIISVRDSLVDIQKNSIREAYKLIMGKIGIKPNENGTIGALKCSPYIYLQSIFLFQGEPVGKKESLLAIDEAQGIAPEEIALLRNVNGGNVVLNLYGDINQHIEGTKGIESWNELKDIFDYDLYEMQENYRNASQITEYCNRVFDMSMNPINTPGKGVHEMKTEAEFRSEVINQLMDNQRVGLAAILVTNEAEVRYLKNVFSAYVQKFHDMTGEEFSIHRTRWNIITIDDAKGLEFSSVIALSGRMTHNQKYIAYTRALDDLYVYPEVIDVSGVENKSRKTKTTSEYLNDSSTGQTQQEYSEKESLVFHTNSVSVKDYSKSAVRRFFEEKGLEVIDHRSEGGRLWVIGEKHTIRSIVNEAMNMFRISGKYAASRETNNRPGWYTKTDN